MPEPLTGQELAQAPAGPDAAALAARGRVCPVLLHPDPMLRQVCTPVGRLDWDSLCQLAGDLLVTMYHAGGRGLAAPQIGRPFRIFVMDPGWKDGTPQPMIVLDPQILPLPGGSESAMESCLSLPGQPLPVTRALSVCMAHYDLMGNAVTTVLDGIPARIAQHETDHLDGRLILDLQAGGAAVNS